MKSQGKTMKILFVNNVIITKIKLLSAICR